ncbi:hypothetical protein [Lentibacillus saliphilus]|uniref:hypothetical protein n=1 Tax=Lentibacillus saliphilus TaxID=2737028 RepID=UPI001C310B2D|nr:hypothetical protein [Lentibacillus saliphilus]
MSTTVNIKYKDIISYILVFFLCMLVSLLVYFFGDYNGYELLFTQPIIFGLLYVIILGKFVQSDKRNLFFLVLISISFIRYVVLPLFIVISNYYGGRSAIEPESFSFYKAILLMNYELLVISFFIWVMDKTSTKKIGVNKESFNQDITSNGNDIVYILSSIFAVGGIILYPSVLHSINFVIPKATDVELNLLENFIVYLFIISKQLLFIMASKKLFRKYIKSRSQTIIFVNFLVAILNICVYYGTNRSDILISFIVSFLLLHKLYGKNIRKYIIIGVTLIILILGVVTTAREHASISGGTNFTKDLTDTLQVYTGGPYNVAIAIETKQYFPDANNPSVLFFDIFRPMIGVNILVKNLPFEYSNIYYNKRMWLDIDRRSQILPMIGQGNLYFGFFLAPIFSLLFIGLFYLLNKRIQITNNLEVYYFLSLVIVRLGFFMGQNTMNMINDLSMNLVLFLFIFYLNRLVKNSIKL